MQTSESPDPRQKISVNDYRTPVRVSNGSQHSRSTPSRGISGDSFQDEDNGISLHKAGMDEEFVKMLVRNQIDEQIQEVNTRLDDLFLKLDNQDNGQKSTAALDIMVKDQELIRAELKDMRMLQVKHVAEMKIIKLMTNARKA